MIDIIKPFVKLLMLFGVAAIAAVIVLLSEGSNKK